MSIRKRPRDAQEIIEETVDGEIMEWDLQDLCWESSTDHLELDPRQDHHDHDDHNLVQLDFTNSTLTPPPKSTSQTSEANNNNNNNNNATPPASGGPPKRAIRAQKMSCLVDGCNADLSGCRDYHRRHRVCERHSKAPTVSVKGEEKRFCQQCSRFHSLGEFDEVKRSCRKRLDGHNRRRRKSQPEPLYFSSKSFLSGYKGPRILHFGNPQICATASVRTLWPVETKTEPEPWLYSSPHKRFQATSQPSPQTCLGGKVNNYYQQSSAEQFLCYPFEPPQAGRGRNNEHHRAMVSSLSFDEEISLPIDSGGRALYLLSTNPTPQPSESCSVQLLDYDPKDKAVPDYPFPTSYYNIANKTIIDNDVGVYALRMGPDSLLEHGALQMLPISLE